MTLYQIQSGWLIADNRNEGELIELPSDLQAIYDELRAGDEDFNPQKTPKEKEQEWLGKGAISTSIDPTKIPRSRVDFDKLEAEVKTAGVWQSAYQKAKNSVPINTAYRATVEAVREGNVEDLYFFAQDLIDVANTEANPFTAFEIQSLNSAFDAAGLVGNLSDPNA
jgi:hypothetical protein